MVCASRRDPFLTSRPLAQLLLAARPRHTGGKSGAGPGGKPGMTTTHPTGPPTACLREGPPGDVTTWRRCRLLDAGFPPDLATNLACTPGVDLHEVLQLVDRGCAPALAARILLPYGAEVRP